MHDLQIFCARRIPINTSEFDGPFFNDSSRSSILIVVEILLHTNEQFANFSCAKCNKANWVGLVSAAVALNP